jgi:hypothetical protein
LPRPVPLPTIAEGVGKRRPYKHAGTQACGYMKRERSTALRPSKCRLNVTVLDPLRLLVPQSNGVVTVKNHKLVCSAVRQATGTTLSKKEIDLIVHRLEERCRDVEL